jgi:23S rRNA pseudouridine2605 synthase
VGRLDRATLGLLLLTNDGDLAKKLSHPSHGVSKVYHIVLDKPVAEEHLELIRKGLVLEDGPTPVDGVNYIKNAPKTDVGIEIHIGRNRIVRRIFEHFGYIVKKLDRTIYAGLTKKDLPRGRFRHLTEKEVIMLKHFT